MNYEILVVVRGPEYQRDTGYGPRTDREQYAHLEVPVNSATAWAILKYAIAEATSADVIVRGES